MVLCGPNIQTHARCRPGVVSDKQPDIIWEILCTALAMAGKALDWVHRCFDEILPAHFVRGAIPV